LEQTIKSYYSALKLFFEWIAESKLDKVTNQECCPPEVDYQNSAKTNKVYKLIGQFFLKKNKKN